MHTMNMQLTVVFGGLDFAYRLAGAARRPLLMTTGTRVWTLNPSKYIIIVLDEKRDDVQHEMYNKRRNIMVKVAK